MRAAKLGMRKIARVRHSDAIHAAYDDGGDVAAFQRRLRSATLAAMAIALRRWQWL